MPTLKPSQLATAIALVAGALGGSTALAGFLMGHGTDGAVVGLAITEIGLGANALAPYLAQIGD